MQANRTAYRYDTTYRRQQARRRTSDTAGKERTLPENQESKFIKKIVWQTAMSLALFALLFGFQFLPYEPFAGITNYTKYMLQKNIDFPAVYERSTAFLKTNLTKEKVDGYMANLTAFFTGQPVAVTTQPPELDLLLKSPVAGSVQQPYLAETGKVGYLTSKSEGVIAALGGTVKEAGYNDTDRNFVVVTHENGIETGYYNLSEVLVHTGDEISQGMIVGNSSGEEGELLYFRLAKDGSALDPTPYFEENQIQGEGNEPQQEQGHAAQ